jgi:hypothetical protein
MKIVVLTGSTPQTMRPTSILDEDDETQFILADTLQIGGDYAEQIEEFLRGDYVDVQERGQERTELSFQVCRLHDSIYAAQVFILDHRNALPRQGQLYVEVVSELGNKEFVMDNALIRKPKLVRWLGCTTFFQYSMIGGRLAAANSP